MKYSKKNNLNYNTLYNQSAAEFEGLVHVVLRIKLNPAIPAKIHGFYRLR